MCWITINIKSISVWHFFTMPLDFNFTAHVFTFSSFQLYIWYKKTGDDRFVSHRLQCWTEPWSFGFWLWPSACCLQLVSHVTDSPLNKHNLCCCAGGTSAVSSFSLHSLRNTISADLSGNGGHLISDVKITLCEESVISGLNHTSDTKADSI